MSKIGVRWLTESSLIKKQRMQAFLGYFQLDRMRQPGVTNTVPLLNNVSTGHLGNKPREAVGYRDVREQGSLFCVVVEAVTIDYLVRFNKFISKIFY